MFSTNYFIYVFNTGKIFYCGIPRNKQDISCAWKKVMLDRDLAQMYKVTTSQLKRQVRRNIDRFPGDFMFEMNKSELKNWRSQFGISNEEKMGLRYRPF